MGWLDYDDTFLVLDFNASASICLSFSVSVSTASLRAQRGWKGHKCMHFATKGCDNDMTI